MDKRFYNCIEDKEISTKGTEITLTLHKSLFHCSLSLSKEKR